MYVIHFTLALRVLYILLTFLDNVIKTHKNKLLIFLLFHLLPRSKNSMKHRYDQYKWEIISGQEDPLTSTIFGLVKLQAS